MENIKLTIPEILTIVVLLIVISFGVYISLTKDEVYRGKEKLVCDTIIKHDTTYVWKIKN
jgi:ABC-type polysaccharide transport system permease subunit